MRFRFKFCAISFFRLYKKDIFFSVNYENVGRRFENNTLSFVMNGMERVTAQAESYWWRSQVYLKLEYNYLIQKSLYSQGVQNKFGLDIKTQFRNLPNLSFSYKPFAAIRNPYDTFSIAQRQVLGSVVMLNLNYMYKTKTSLLRVMFMQNRSRSVLDAQQMATQTSQFMVMYSHGSRVMGNLIVGTFKNVSHETYQHTYQLYNNNNFINGSLSYRLSGDLTMTGGGDFSFNATSVLRSGGHLGASYTFKKIPLSLRVNNRFYRYRLYEDSAMNNIYMVSLDIGYRFLYNLD